MIKPTTTLKPTAAAELDANIRESRQHAAQHARALRTDAARARLLAREAAEAGRTDLARTYAALAERTTEDARDAARDAANAHPRLRTAANACARADRFEAAAAIFRSHGATDWRGSRNASDAARHLALAKSLRAHARDLPAR